MATKRGKLPDLRPPIKATTRIVDPTYLGRVLAIDPGVAGAGCACAWLQGGELLQVDYRKRMRGGDRTAQLIAVERPCYQGDRSNGARVQDLINLAWAGASLAYEYSGRYGATVTEYTPTAWKGSAPKPVHHARLWEQLNEDERALLGGVTTKLQIDAAVERGARVGWKGVPGASAYASWKGHNLLDAAGLGLFAVGRRF